MPNPWDGVGGALGYTAGGYYDQVQDWRRNLADFGTDLRGQGLSHEDFRTQMRDYKTDNPWPTFGGGAVEIPGGSSPGQTPMGHSMYQGPDGAWHIDYGTATGRYMGTTPSGFGLAFQTPGIPTTQRMGYNWEEAEPAWRMRNDFRQRHADETAMYERLGIADPRFNARSPNNADPGGTGTPPPQWWIDRENARVPGGAFAASQRATGAEYQASDSLGLGAPQASMGVVLTNPRAAMGLGQPASAQVQQPFTSTNPFPNQGQNQMQGVGFGGGNPQQGMQPAGQLTSQQSIAQQEDPTRPNIMPLGWQPNQTTNVYGTRR